MLKSVLLLSVLLFSACTVKPTVQTSDENKTAELNVAVELESIEKTFEINTKSEEIKVVYFEYDSYEIAESYEQNLSELTSTTSILLTGNCDEFGSDEYNFALGLKRAEVVKDRLVANGIDKSLISLLSLGETNPICSDGSSECYNANRRVDIKK